MAKNITQYSLFISSPQDLETERSEISNIINEINLTYSSRKSVNLDVIKWETHSAPGITDTYTQNLINNDLGNEYDVFIGMLWQKFGTKTEIANSGTEEEFLKAVERYKNGDKIQILFYFKTTPPVSLDHLNLDELNKIKKFKEYLKENNILYWSFNTLEDLQTNLRLHIPKRIDELIIKNNSSTENNNTLNNLVKNDRKNVLDDDIGYFDYIFQFEDSLEDSTIALTNISESTKKIGEDLTEKANEMTRISKYPNPNRNIILEYFKRTSKTINSYSDKIEIEIPNFYNNFEDAINIGLKYLNSIDKYNINENVDNIKNNYEQIKELKSSIPHAIEGMNVFYEEAKDLPNIQTDLNKAKRRLLIKLEDLIYKLGKSYELTNEYQGQLEYKLSLYKE